MKRLFFILLILIIGSISMKTYNENPYIGKYQSSNNTTLMLSSNNNCTMIDNLYKGVLYTKGKYVIDNNNINITFDSNEPIYYDVSILTGNFEGSRIKIYNSSEKKYYIYSKE